MLFAKVCDGKLNKKHIGVNLFSSRLYEHELMLTIVCEKGQNLFQDVGDS